MVTHGLLSRAKSGRPIRVRPTVTLLHRAGMRLELVYLFVSNIDTVQRELLIYVGGKDETDVANFLVSSDTTKPLLDGAPFILDKGRGIWALAPAGNLNVFGYIRVA